MTKVFVATVVMQLVDEGALELDAPVAQYVPGLLPAAMPVTVRQLLQHTSGLADYHDLDGLETAADFEARRFDNPTALDRVQLALASSPVSAPGTAYHSTDTNYRVLELVVRAVTGRSISFAIHDRLIEPLELRHTRYPDDAGISGSYLHGYMPADLPEQPFGDQAHLIDYTFQTLDQTGAAGALISSAPDLDRLFEALLGGELVSPAALAEMMTTVPVDEDSAALGVTGAGLGLESWDVGCGTMWGHGGSTRGYTTLALASADGRATTILAVNQDPPPLAAYEPVLRALATSACR